MMSFEVGKRALDFLVENSGTRHNLEVDFFGGEPLMNFQVVKDLVAYARSIEKEKGKNFFSSSIVLPPFYFIDLLLLYHRFLFGQYFYTAR